MEGNSTQGYVELVVAKHRNGSLDNIPLKYIGKYLKYVSPDDDNPFAKGTMQELGSKVNEIESKANSLRPSQQFDSDEPPF
jgi:replicative DNA helicase